MYFMDRIKTKTNVFEKMFEMNYSEAVNFAFFTFHYMAATGYRKKVGFAGTKIQKFENTIGDSTNNTFIHFFFPSPYHNKII